MVKKIPFKISARTARLIGRQNFPNAEGAIIELVKNSYDADASICIVVFENRYAVLPETIRGSEYSRFLKQSSLISKYYHPNINEVGYVFKEPSYQDQGEQAIITRERSELQEFFQAQCKLYIIDNGEGMTDQIIEDFWMTIGTSNKELDVYTRTGRIKTGAKGIGRFALDKLGDSTEMLTKPNRQVYEDVAPHTGFLWSVDWTSFEGTTKTLNQVEAELIDVEVPDFAQEVKRVLPSCALNHPDLQIATFKMGTRIEISDLRDQWTDRLVGRLFGNLEVLIPPREEKLFDVFLFSTLEPKKYGQVAPSICDDYDYKVNTRVDNNGMAEIIIYRNEFDVTRFPSELFQREVMKNEPFTKKAFERKKIVIKKHIKELTSGLAGVDDRGVLEHIGAFDFVFYFMKAQSTKRDSEVFLYKDVNSASRRAWFKQFGGIKLFRDNFRIRPYGEINNAAFDWLQLGERAARSPSSIGQQRQTTWRVRPNQISGIINISRLTNIDFEDTSSRYGLQENQTFAYFSQVILGILDVFEGDRKSIGRELRAYYDTTHQDEISPKKAATVKERVRKSQSKPKKSQAEQDSVTLLRYTETLEEQIEELKDETKLLKILASSGLVVASFTHELQNIEDNLVFRIDELNEYLLPVVDMDKCEELPLFLNPFTHLEIIKHEDEKLKEWLHYSLKTLRKDKRRRIDIDLLKYFENYKKSWNVALNQQGVQFNFMPPGSGEVKIRIFEAELDSIFNNLLINSFEAFLRKDAPSERTITLRLEIYGSDIHIIYQDSGPGLSKDIVNPKKIFAPLFTTKKDPLTGKDTGTGLGMWLVKSFVTENNGSVEVIENQPGFGVLLKFFNKVKVL